MNGAEKRADGSETATRIGAVVVVYYPDADFLDRLARMGAETDEFVVVNNGATDESKQRLASWCAANRAILITNRKNEGLGAALNRGARAALGGAAWLLCFDQDSIPEPEMVRAMVGMLEAYNERDQVAVIGPTIRDKDGVDHRWLRPHPWLPGGFRKERVVSADLQPVTMVITSGSLVRLDVWQRLGGFDEGLFIDGVDTDFCLRARSAGWQVCAAPAAVLHHRLGNRTRTSIPGPLGRPTHHSALRHYYIARNRVLLFRRHALRTPHWSAFEISMVAVWLFRILVFEERKWTKLRAMAIGTWDGTLGRSGPCSPERRRSLAR